MSKVPSPSLNAKGDARKVALILHGSGVYDGTEIQEACSFLIHLDKAGAIVSMFAPDMEQPSVVNHLNGSDVFEKRNVLIESARIARGKISPLKLLKSADFDALFIPGGFGVAKTLSDFAVSGSSCKIQNHTEKVIKDFISEKKPIGMCCIAPILAARLLPRVRITLGKESNEDGSWEDSGACMAAVEMGAVHIQRDITEICVDKKYKLVTAPAYMYSKATIGQVFDNIGLLVKKVLSMIKC